MLAVPGRSLLLNCTAKDLGDQPALEPARRVSLGRCCMAYAGTSRCWALVLSCCGGAPAGDENVMLTLPG